MGGGALGERADLAGGARLPQRVQQPSQDIRAVEAGVGGGVAVLSSSGLTWRLAPASRSAFSSRPTA
jgi:hypothetical protein